MSERYENGIDPVTGDEVLMLVKPNGERLPVRDRRVYEREHAANSHEDFFARQQAQEANYWEKRRIDRSGVLQQEFEAAAQNRLAINFSPNVEEVPDDVYLGTLRHDPDFKPLASYIDKLKIRRDGVWTGKYCRPILEGEVGMIGDKIFKLEAGYGRPVQGADLGT